MPRCSAAGLDFRIIPAGFNAPLEFLTGFTHANMPQKLYKADFSDFSIGFVARKIMSSRTNLEMV